MSTALPESIFSDPSRHHVLVLSAVAGSSVVSYSFAGLLVNSFILAYTDHVMICIVLAVEVALVLWLLMGWNYDGWRATKNGCLRLTDMALLFTISLVIYVVLLLAQTLVTSPFFAPSVGNSVIYYLLLLFTALALILAVGRRSIAVVAGAGD